MPEWVQAGFFEYTKRLSAFCQFQLVEIPLSKRPKNADIPRLMQKEAALVLAAIQPKDIVVALEVTGKNLSTEKLSKQLLQWQHTGFDICFLIGGPEGIHENVKNRSDMQVSLSSLTLPHPMVRIIVAEQLYRAFSILAGHPYHR